MKIAPSQTDKKTSLRPEAFNTTQTNPIAIRPEEATTHTVSFGRIVITFPRKFISISAEIH